MALDLAKDGWNIAVHCHESIGEAAELVDEMRRLGRKAVAIEGDLAQARDAEEARSRRPRARSGR